MNLDQSKAFDSVGYGFLEAVLSGTGFGFHFRSWICLLYTSSDRFLMHDSQGYPPGRTQSYTASHYLTHVWRTCTPHTLTMQRIRKVRGREMGQN